MTAILEVHDLVKTFGGLVVLNRCSFQVRRGTITGLIGPNGAGKTTLFNVLTGFHKPDSGRVLFNGRDITGLAPHQIFHHRICRTFQIPREFRDMTMLLIEHDMDLVMRLCDPVIVLSEGHPLVEGPFEVVAKDPRVLEAYLGGG